jgi:hypothetical protein
MFDKEKSRKMEKKQRGVTLKGRKKGGVRRGQGRKGEIGEENKKRITKRG